jgi:hypothetical protein
MKDPVDNLWTIPRSADGKPAALVAGECSAAPVIWLRWNATP